MVGVVCKSPNVCLSVWGSVVKQWGGEMHHRAYAGGDSHNMETGVDCIPVAEWAGVAWEQQDARPQNKTHRSMLCQANDRHIPSPTHHVGFPGPTCVPENSECYWLNYGNRYGIISGTLILGRCGHRRTQRCQGWRRSIIQVCRNVLSS